MNVEYVKKLKMSESALVIVDCQRDFMYPGAPLENPLAMEKLPNIISAKKWAYEHGIPVIYTKGQSVWFHTSPSGCQCGSCLQPMRRSSSG